MADEKQNAKQFPAKFYAKHMQPGIARYENETILVDTEHMKLMMPSFIGMPVYVLHQEVKLETLKEDSHGIISNSFYNDLDGWFWVEFMATDDIAFQAIANGWSVSNAYIPTEWGGGGTWHNCPYDRQILNGKYTHLAIVPDPRYEGACILTPDEFKSYQAAQRERLTELQNSKSEGKRTMKFWKNKKEEVATVDEDTMVELQNGKSASLKEMIDAVEAKEKSDEIKNAGDQKVMVNGKEMTVTELTNAYCALKNASEEEEKKNAEADADEEAEEMTNSDEDEEKKNESDDEGEKKNSADEKKDHFKELTNAHLNAKPEVTTIETSMDKLARGKLVYGSPAKR